MIRTDIMNEGMDTEWMALILEAKKLGITKEIIREFLSQNEVTDLLAENG